MRSLSVFAAKTSAVDEAVQIVASVAQKAGIPGAYIAGGWVRDKILGKDSKDVDITVEGGRGIELAEKVAEAVGYKLDPNKDIYKAKGTAKVTVPTSAGNLLVEFVSARKETYAPEGHKPIDVKPGTIEDDVFRRDFTLNSLIVDIQDYHPNMTPEEFRSIVKDLTGKGLEDLDNKVLRTPLNPVQTFEDDPTRIARAIRFCAQKGFSLAPETEEAIKSGKSSSGEELRSMLMSGRKAPKGSQIGDELRKAFLSDPIRTVELLKDTGLGDSLGMDLSQLDVEQTDYRGLHSKNVYQHSLQALENMVDQVKDAETRGETFDDDRKLALFLSAIYHDVGKKETQQIVCGGKVNEKGQLEHCHYRFKPTDDLGTCPKCGAKNRAKIQFLGHEMRGKDMIDPLLGKFFGNKIREKIKGLVENHMTHHNYSRDREAELEKLYRMKERAEKYGDTKKIEQLELEIKRKENLIDIPSSRKELARLVEIYSADPDIKYLWQADLTTKDREHKTQRKKNIDKLVGAFDEFGPVEGALNGKEIMEIFNIPPGPKVKKVLEQLKQLKIKDPKFGKPEEVREYLKDKQLNEDGLIIQIRPILDGNDLIGLYDKKPGSWLQPILQRLRDETLKGTFKSKEDAIMWLKEHEAEFGNLKQFSVLRPLSLTAAKWIKDWKKCPKCEQFRMLELRDSESDRVSRECHACGFKWANYASDTGEKYLTPEQKSIAMQALKDGRKIVDDGYGGILIEDGYGGNIHFAEGYRSLSVYADLYVDAAHWTEPELKKVRDYYLAEREKGRKDDNNIYNEIAKKLKDRTPRAIKQKVEQFKNTDESFKKHKFKHWTYEDVMNALKDIYRSNPDNFHRTGLPEDLRSQIKLHIGDWFHSFDLAMGKAIREVEREKGIEISMDEAIKKYLHQHKLAHRWTKEDVLSLFKTAHDLGLPITQNFFAKQPEVYKPALGINRSLEGLKDSVKRLFGCWGQAVIEAGLVDNKYYDEDGKALGSTEEVRLARFFDLNNIKYRKCTTKIAVTDPEILDLGYKNFMGDFYILDSQDKEIAMVEVFGSIINSGKINPAYNKTIGELYREKREAKITYYSRALGMPFIYIDNDEHIELSDDRLKEKFANFLAIKQANLRMLSKDATSEPSGSHTLRSLSS